MVTHQSIAWGEEVGGLRLGVHTGKSIYRFGESPISLEIRILNTGTRAVEIVESNLLADYSLEVLRADGLPVPWSSQGESARQTSQLVKRRLTIEIDPGAVHQVLPAAPLDTWFQFDEGGRYTVRAVREDWKAEGKTLSSGSWSFLLEPVT
jgi:hypothetical protein